MNDIRLFHIGDEGVSELQPHHSPMENELQNLIEKNMELFMGIKLLKRQHGTGRFQRGYIDSLGIDENGCPVIVEYKRRSNENIITQGLFYLDWLMDHQGDFFLLVQEHFGKDVASGIEFGSPRIICVASSFNRYDERAVCQIGKSVELVRYRLFGKDYLMLEMVNSSLSPYLHEVGEKAREADSDLGMPAQMRSRIKNMTISTENLYFELIDFIESLGEDVNIRFLKHYIAFVRMKNFTCIQPMKNGLKMWLYLDPAGIVQEDGFGRDVTDIGHHSSGNLEYDIFNKEDLSRAKPYIEMAYQTN